MDQQDRNFYHSFPRPHAGDSHERTIKDGLERLKTIQQIGLILAPEIVTWKQLMGSNSSRDILINQHRICFTELSRDELATHGEKCGPFSLEFHIDDLRRVGALPVIYIPQDLKNDVDGYSTLGGTIVGTLNDLKITSGQLYNYHLISDRTYVEAKYNKPVQPDYSLILNNTNPMTNQLEARYEVVPEHIKNLLDHLQYRTTPFELMESTLAFVQNLMYPTDDTHNDKQMEYYRQREWRLGQGLIKGGTPQCRYLTDSEKQTLLKGLNRAFWRKKLSDGVRKFRRIDDSYVLDKFEGKQVTELISTVIVPPEAYDDARALFGDKVSLS